MKKVNILVCLVGEQPVPNLLPIREFQPDKVILMISDRTTNVGNNLKKLFGNRQTEFLKVSNPYDIVGCELGLQKLLKDKFSDNEESEFAFNLTGGTKPMSLAAYNLARRMNAPIIYLQSEGAESVIYIYESKFGDLAAPVRQLSTRFLSIDDYLQVHGLPKPKISRPKNLFEKQVSEILVEQVSEIRRCVRVSESLEIDLVLRCGSKFGIAELKTGNDARKKSPIDQLVGATGREFLGIYTKRILILDQEPARENRQLAESYNVNIIVLKSYSQTGTINQSDGQKLISAIEKILGKKK